MAIFKRGDFLYRSGERTENIFIIEDGAVEIQIFDKVTLVEKGSLGEWCLIDSPSIESAKVLNTSKIEVINPKVFLQDNDYSDILLEIFESVSKRLFFLDEVMLDNLDYSKAKENFRKTYKYYKEFDSDFVKQFSKMKYHFRKDEYLQSLEELNKISLNHLSYDLLEEIEIWKTILRFKINKDLGRQYASFFDDKKSYNQLSYNYLKKLMKNEKNTFYDIFAKYGLKIPEKTVIIREGEEAQNKGFYLFDGALKVGRFSSNINNLIAIISKGEFFGESSLFEKTMRQATVFTDKPCDIIVFTKEILKNVLKVSSKFGLELIQNQLKRTLLVIKMMDILSISDNNKRVAKLIENFGKHFKTAGFTINEIASIANVDNDIALDILKALKLKLTPEGYIKNTNIQ
jgi:CRP-like cAMP-binding protein